MTNILSFNSTEKEEKYRTSEIASFPSIIPCQQTRVFDGPRQANFLAMYTSSLVLGCTRAYNGHIVFYTTDARGAGLSQSLVSNGDNVRSWHMCGGTLWLLAKCPGDRGIWYTRFLSRDFHAPPDCHDELDGTVAGCRAKLS